jgi:Ca2+-binding RTX toxin-like protein
MAVYLGTTGDDNLTGSAGDDELYGLDGDDILEGGDGDDLLDGGTGSDAMSGGVGNDVYFVDWYGDSVIEAANEGLDEVRTTLSDYTLAANVENGVSFSTSYHWLTGNALDNVLKGSDADSYVFSQGGDDTILRSGGYDQIFGGDGYDTLVLAGTLADYVITKAYGSVSIRDVAGDDGMADVRLYDVEAIRFEGDNEIFDVATAFDRFGTAGDDVLTGDANDNKLFGYEGSDTLYGLGGNDELDGGAGVDMMAGGAGDDYYYVDESADAVVEAAGAGYDVILLAASSYNLGTASVEEIWSVYSGNSNIIGSAIANAIYADVGDDWLEGRGGNDYLVGDAGDDHLEGGNGNDELNGGAGDDVMIGGTGDDLYYVSEAGDVVTEASGSGTDTVRLYLSSYTIPTNVENLDLSYGSSGSWTVTGNSLANVFTLGFGANTVSGGAGNDTAVFAGDWEGVVVDLQTGEMGGAAADDLLTSIENLTGTWSDDTLRGTAGANVLDGGGGADTLVGRGGNDIYYVDNEGDLVVETENEGADEVRLSWLSAYAMPDHVERAKQLTGNDVMITGNALNNDIAGSAGADTLSGGDGQDSLSGGAGDDSLYGGAGHDTLSGGSGADHMAGGDGNDVYIVDHAGDTVVELAGQGIDQVYVSVSSFTLADTLENLTFQGYGAFQGTGNDSANVIYGGSGNDTLSGLGGDDEIRAGSGNDIVSGGAGDDLVVGGSGADVMTGGSGADLFRISSYESGVGTAADRITDFVSGEDRIDLANIDAAFWTPGDQAFTFVGGAAFSGTAGELRFGFDGVDTWVEGDTDGDGAADFAIALWGQVTPLASDFIL